MNVTKITYRQIIVIGIVYMLPYVIDEIHSLNHAKQYTYVTYLVAAVIFMGVLWMLSHCAKRFPDQSLFQSLTLRFPIGGRVIGFLYLLFFLYILSRDIRTAVDFTNTILLPFTPLVVISIFILITTICITRGGLRTVISLSEVMLTPFVVAVFLMALMLFKDFHLDYMKPFFHMNMPSIRNGSLVAMSYIGQVVALPFFISSKDYRKRDHLYAIAICTMLIVMVVLMIILTLGVPVARRVMYPTFELVNEINIADFLDRFEYFMIALWYPLILINMAITLYILCYGLKIMVPSLSGKMMVAPVGSLAFACSWVFFHDKIQMLSFNDQWAWIAPVFEIIIPIGIFMVLRPRKSSLKH